MKGNYSINKFIAKGKPEAGNAKEENIFGLIEDLRKQFGPINVEQFCFSQLSSQFLWKYYNMLCHVRQSTHNSVVSFPNPVNPVLSRRRRRHVAALSIFLSLGEFLRS